MIFSRGGGEGGIHVNAQRLLFFVVVFGINPKESTNQPTLTILNQRF